MNQPVIFSCSICTGEYNESDHLPKFLSCFHTFCLSCLKHLENNFSVTCPVCRNETNLGENGVHGLQNNFYICQHMASSTSSEGISIDKEKKPADVKWCFTCKRVPAKDCLMDHVIDTLQAENCKLHLQTSLNTCKMQWTIALNKLLQVQTSIAAVCNALSAVQKHADQIRSENKRTLHQFRCVLQEIDKESETKLQKESLECMIEALGKYAAMEEDSKNAMKEASKLQSFLDAVKDVTLSVEARNTENQNISSFDRIKLGFPVEDSDPERANALTSISYLILNDKFGKEFQTLSMEKKGEISIKKDPKEVRKGKKPSEFVKTNKKPIESKQKLQSGKQKDSVVDFSKPSCSAIVNQSQTPSKRSVEKGAKPKENQQFAKQRVNEKKNVAEDTTSTADELAKFFREATVFSSVDVSAIPTKCFMYFELNGKPYGRITIQLRPDVAKIMCKKFVECCTGGGGQMYNGTPVFKGSSGSHLVGGRMGTEVLYIGDRSPLKNIRGTISMSLKRDYTKTNCFIVGTEFIIQLRDAPNQHRDSTVFGNVVDGIAVCDAISHLDHQRDTVTISSTRVV